MMKMKQKMRVLAAVILIAATDGRAVLAAPAGETLFAAPATGVIKLDESSVPGTPDRLFARDLTYRTWDPQDDPAAHFAPSAFLGEEEYRIESFSAPVVREQESAPAAGGTYISEPFTGDGSDHAPAPVREFDGVQMELVSSTLIDTETEERTEEQSVTYEYEGLEAGASVPRTQEIEFTDGDTGHVFTAELPLLSSETTERYWSSSFSFPVHVENYDADVYELGGVEIPKDDPLIDHAADLLRILSLDPSCYEIAAVDWTGEPYRDAAGVLCRDARATGRKLLRDVSAIYGGMVTYPAVPAKAWQCEYREIVPEGRAVVYTMSVDVTLIRASLVPDTAGSGSPSGLKGLISAAYEAIKAAVRKVAAVVREHPAESVACLVVTAAFIVFVLMMKPERKCIYKNNIRCPYRKRTEDKCRSCMYRYQTEKPQPKGLFKPRKTKAEDPKQQ